MRQYLRDINSCNGSLSVDPRSNYLLPVTRERDDYCRCRGALFSLQFVIGRGEVGGFSAPFLRQSGLGKRGIKGEPTCLFVPVSHCRLDRRETTSVAGLIAGRG